MAQYATLYNNLDTNDIDFRATDTMDQESIEYFLIMMNSFLQGDAKGQIYDVDGVKINPAYLIYTDSNKYNINPQVLLTQLEKETTSITDSTKSTYWQERILGCKCTNCSTIRGQISYAAEMLGNDYCSVMAGQPILGIWQSVGVTQPAPMAFR